MTYGTQNETIDSFNLDFLVDDDIKEEVRESKEKFKVVIADDDDEVHKLTKMILEDFRFDGVGLEFIDTYSGEETKAYFKEHDDIALVFLDVVMEKDSSGLEVVKYIRDELKNNFVRIVLRTGQPGKAPEEKIIAEYDINDYKSKTELTVQKLYTTLYSGLRSYRDLRIIDNNKKGLEQVIDASTDLFKYTSFNKFVGGILYQLTSLLDFERDAFYSRKVDATNEGFIALKNNSQNLIFAGTGKYKACIGQTVDDILEEEVKSKIQSLSENEVRFYENLYIGHHKGPNNIDNYIYMEGTDGISDMDKSLIKIFLTNFSIAFDNYQLNKDIYDTQKEIIFTLGEMVEKRHETTANHVRRVSEIAYVLAKYYGVDEEECDLIKVAVPMHDVGKIAIPDRILLKPDKLTYEEFEIMKTHAEIGHKILSSSSKPLLQLAARIALEHHERWDGTGYPLGKKGEEIFLAARVATVADVFDALTHDRCYKEAWSIDQTLDFIKTNSGTMFEPKIVDILFEHVHELVRIMEKYAD